MTESSISKTNNNTTCVCKGLRTCGICRPDLYSLLQQQQQQQQPDSVTSQHQHNDFLHLLYCPQCQQLFQQDQHQQSYLVNCKDHTGEQQLPVDISKMGNQVKPFTGLAIVPNFVSSAEEENNIVQFLDADEQNRWQPSQSGRGKIDFGPRANFKQRKAQHRPTFKGFPLAFKALLPRVSKVVSEISKNDECKFGYRFTSNKGFEIPPDVLEKEGDCDCGRATTRTAVEEETENDYMKNNHFSIAEIAALDYRPTICSNLDAHMDDAWIWGSRVGGISFLTHSVMTFIQAIENTPTTISVRVLLPRGALFVLSDAVRYHWLHGIYSSDIKERRLSLTIRELSKDFVKEEPELAAEFLATASNFC